MLVFDLSRSKVTLELLKDARSKVGVFVHNLEEVDYILKNAEKELESPTGGYGDVLFSLREIGKTPSDIALLRSQLNEYLENHNISIEETPRYIDEFQIDEKLLELKMEEANLFYRSNLAKRADINSIRSIFVIRENHVIHRVEDSIAIMVTNNSALAKTAYYFARTHNQRDTVSPVITDYSLTNILWLKSPIESNTLPEYLISANCYAALRPSDNLWSQFLAEIIKLKQNNTITAEQHLYLRYELRVREELMNMTMGDESILSEPQVLQLLDHYEDNLIRPWKEKYKEIKEVHDSSSDTFKKTADELIKIHTNIKNIGIVVEKIVSSLFFLLFLYLLIYSGINDFNTALLKGWLLLSTQILLFLLNLLAIHSLIYVSKGWNPLNWIPRKANKFAIFLLNLLLIKK